MLKKLTVTVIITVITIIGINLNLFNIYAATTVPAEEGGTSQSEQEASKDSVDGIITGAEDFLKEGIGSTAIDEAKLKTTSNFIYNLLLGVAMVVAVIVGMIIGMQFMLASVEEKAKIKEALIPYVVGCVVVFGAFGIWKLVVNVLSKW